MLDIVMSKALITSNTIIEDTDIDNHEFGFAIHINDGSMPTWYLRADTLREKKRYLYVSLLFLLLLFHIFIFNLVGQCV